MARAAELKKNKDTETQTIMLIIYVLELIYLWKLKQKYWKIKQLKYYYALLYPTLRNFKQKGSCGNCFE